VLLSYFKWKSLLRLSQDYSAEKQEAVVREFNLGNWDSWNLNQETGELIFSSGDVPMVVANVEVAGTYSNETKTWLWGWASEYILEKVSSRIGQVALVGKELKHKKLTKRKFPVSEKESWELTNISAYVLKAQMVYRAPTSNGHIYLCVMDINYAEKA
jgi:Family of unknown function (DUF6882)